MFDATKAIIDFYEDSGEDEVSEEARDELVGAVELIEKHKECITALIADVEYFARIGAFTTNIKSVRDARKLIGEVDAN